MKIKIALKSERVYEKNKKRNNNSQIQAYAHIRKHSQAPTHIQPANAPVRHMLAKHAQKLLTDDRA